MKRRVGIGILVSALLLGGCGLSGGEQGKPDSEGTTASAPGEPTTDETEDLVDEEALPIGHCGKAPDAFDDQMVYAGSKETDCREGMEILTALANGEDNDSNSVAGHGTSVRDWSCAFPMDNEVTDYAVTLFCEKGPQQIFVRPASLTVPAGYHVQPWDYGSPPNGLYFTTESRKHHCNFNEGMLGCDNFNFPDDLPPVRYMGQPQQPTAIVLEAQGSPRFEVYGDPTFTQYSDSGEWGADTRVLGYGEVLWVRGIACTTDPDRGVVCTNGQHGFEISSKRYAMS